MPTLDEGPRDECAVVLDEDAAVDSAVGVKDVGDGFADGATVPLAVL